MSGKTITKLSEKGNEYLFFFKSRRVVKKKRELIKGTDWLEVGPHLFLLLVLCLSLLFDMFHNHIHTYPACNVIFGLTCSGLVLTRYFCWFIFLESLGLQNFPSLRERCLSVPEMPLLDTIASPWSRLLSLPLSLPLSVPSVLSYTHTHTQFNSMFSSYRVALTD